MTDSSVSSRRLSFMPSSEEGGKALLMFADHHLRTEHKTAAVSSREGSGKRGRCENLLDEWQEAGW